MNVSYYYNNSLLNINYSFKGEFNKLKKLFLGTYEQVKEGISKSFIEDSLDIAKDFTAKKIPGFLILFIGFGTYALFGVSYYLSNNLEDTVVNLDINNEFIPFLSSIWYANLQIIPVLITIFTMLWYRNRNRIKGHLFYHLFMTFFLIMVNLLFLKTFQLFVSNFPLRIIYTILYIISFIYAVLKSYQNAMNMIYTSEKKRLFIVEWFSINKKIILSIGAVFGGVYYAGKAMFETGADLETRIIGNFIEFFPLLSVLINISFIYFFGVVIRSYYLQKYSKKFRKDFAYEKEDWYGPKYDKYKNS